MRAKGRNRIGILAAAAALASALACVPNASAANTYTVTTTTDPPPVANACTASAPPNTPCSLREAIIAANNDTTPPASVSVPAGHYVLAYASGTPATTELAPTQSMTIGGAGASTTIIDAGGPAASTPGRVFDIGGSGPSVTIQGVTVTGGVAPTTGLFLGDAGGILDAEGGGSLTLNGDNVSGNAATFTGGGVDTPIESGATDASVSINQSTISDNTISGTGNGLGAGIVAGNSLSVTNSTVADNHITSSGEDEGAGIAQAEETPPTTPAVTLTNDTITGNTISGSAAGSLGGGGLSGDNLVFPNSLHPVTTVTTVNAHNTIVADNTVNGSKEDCAAVATHTSDHNISSDSSCGFTDSGSKQNTEPDLGPLQMNGGDTDTEAELPQSPAINAGDNASCPPVDQRGVTRPQAGICDIGAFELVFEADLALKMTQAPKPAVPGKKITYTLTVTNDGPEPAAGVSVRVTLPPSFKLKSKFDRCSGKPLVCQLPDLAAGATKTFKVGASPKKTGRYQVKATVTGTYADPNPSNNTVKLTTRVASPAADLAIDDKASPTSASPGQGVSFTATVKNRGPATATGVAVTDQLPAGLTLVSARTGHGHCTQGAAIRCSLGTLHKGESATVVVVATGSAGGTYTNHVSVTGKQPDPHHKNNKASATVTIGAASTNCQGGQQQRHGSGQTNVCQRNASH